MPRTQARRLATIAEAAEHRRVHHQTIRRYIKRGELTAYRFGDKLLFVDLDELDRKLLRPVATAKSA